MSNQISEYQYKNYINRFEGAGIKIVPHDLYIRTDGNSGQDFYSIPENMAYSFMESVLNNKMDTDSLENSLLF